VGGGEGGTLGWGGGEGVGAGGQVVRAEARCPQERAAGRRGILRRRVRWTPSIGEIA